RQRTDSAFPFDPAPPRRPLVYRVAMEPIGTNAFFLTGRPVELHGDYGTLGVDFNGAILNRGMRTMITSYEATSDVHDADLQLADVASAPVPPRIALTDLQTAKVDRRVLQLAHSITDPEPTPYRKAAALEKYLRSHFSYTLDLGTVRP